MATPKKKISRSRRDKRRYSAANQLKKETWTTNPVTGELARPHCITRQMLESGRHLEGTAKFRKSQGV